MNAEAPARCDVCGGEFPADQVIDLKGRTVCAKCKPDVVMDIKSGVGSGERVPEEEAERIKKRIRNLNLLSFAFALPGIGLQFFSQVFVSPVTAEEARAAASAVLGLQVLGLLLLIVGLGFYAKMRGRSPAFGLLGMLSCLGLLILYFLPKRCHHCGQSQSYRLRACTNCGAPV